MRSAALYRALTLALALCLTGVSPNRATGYADLSRLVASHPLHAVLAGYDREIAALRTTLRAIGLTDPAARTQRATAALQKSAAGARARALRLDTLNSFADLNMERNALATIVRLRGTGDLESSSYGVELDRETSASLTAFEASTAQRTTRALEARRQQLRENELALAYALARRDAGQHLQLRLKLAHLHLDRTDRAVLEGQRASLDRREADAITTLRRADASRPSGIRARAAIGSGERQREDDRAVARHGHSEFWRSTATSSAQSRAPRALCPTFRHNSRSSERAIARARKRPISRATSPPQATISRGASLGSRKRIGNRASPRSPRFEPSKCNATRSIAR